MNFARENTVNVSPPPTLTAQIFPKYEHPITPEKIDTDALYILTKLAEAGFSCYLVGGGVRDLYLGKTPKDFDISTDARPGQIRRLFPNSNTIGRRFRLVQVFFRGGKTIEVSTLRSLSEHDLDGPEEVLAPNNTFGTLGEDAQRRDLTINSLFYEISTGTIIDYVGGVSDLNDGIIRIYGDPARRISRDPVRIMRAIRHAARNGFSIEEKTWDAICRNSHKLSLCPPSRLRDEFLKDLYGGAIGPWFPLAEVSKIFTQLFPLYRPLLLKKAKSNVQIKKSLAHTFATIDRANAIAIDHHVHRQPDYFLLALILVPWAEHNWQLFSEPRKNEALYQLAKIIRDEIDKTIGIDLNLRRSLRQDMANLLINLSLLIHNKTSKGWPKWLKRKSYFKKTNLFYSFYQQIISGKPLTEDCFILNNTTDPYQNSLKHESLPSTDHKEKPASQNSKPLFAHNTKGGIFGFKK